MARAVWRRSFWNADTLGRFGGAYDMLRRDPASVNLAPPLVLGLAMNYTADQLAPFVRSLRASGYSGQIVFLTAGLSDETHAFLRAHSVEAVPFNPGLWAPYHVQNSRWFVYLEYLLGRLMSRSLPRSILLTDVRDVLFQGDPFEMAHGEVGVFLENAPPLLGQCPFNARWLRTCFGEHVLSELASRPITCSGTVIASGKGALAYVIEMWNVMTSFSDVAANDISDQAAHNLIVHRGLVEGIQIHPNGEGVLTLYYVGRDELQISPQGVILGPAGVASPVIHQYDRRPSLKAFAQARYVQPFMDEAAAC